MTRKMRLREALHQAALNRLEDGWLYLPEGTILTPDKPCVLVDDDEARVTLARDGFTRERLETRTLEQTTDCARSLHDPPSDELLVESFRYFLDFDAFLPYPGAPAPPPDGSGLRLDGEFCDRLGPERADQRCTR